MVGACGGAVVKALRYMTEDRGIENLSGELFVSVYLILLATRGPGIYSASNRNECQAKNNTVSGQ